MGLDSMSRKYTTALFDVDGTIITLDGVVKAVQEALTRLDLETMSGHDIIRRFVGHLLVDEFPKLYPHVADQAEEFQKLYTIIFTRKHKEYSKLQPHVKEVLNMLRENDIKIGIVTTKGREEALAVVKDYSLPYDVMISHNDAPAIKPSPLPIATALEKLGEKADRAVMTGDHIFDVMSAQAAGCIGIGVLTGASTKEEFEDIKTPYIIKDLGGLLAIMGL